MSDTRITSASGSVRSLQNPFPPTFSPGVLYRLPSSTPGKRRPIATTSSQVGRRLARDDVVNLEQLRLARLDADVGEHGHQALAECL